MKIQLIIDVELPDFKHTESEMNTMIQDLFPSLKETYKKRFEDRVGIKISGDWSYSKVDPDLFKDEKQHG